MGNTWRHHLSQSEQFRHETEGDVNILQSPALVIQPTDLTSTYFGCTRRELAENEEGRSRTKWLNKVENDLRAVGISRWRAFAPGRTWVRIRCKTALACQKLQCLRRS
ncbi:hypothetical protein TNCV_4920561 [Trichonephila clavipes]|nr:hypothetical protein TNCV_4920561 [Trichonephila clavipes]